jgi:hypothetical protein
MLSTYKAMLQGDHLEWSDEAPSLTRDQPVAVYVTILDEGAPSSKAVSQGQRMAAALERLAATGAFQDVVDPASWQRETRHDRPLPDRDA